jgi:hypothetical protein
MCSEILTKMHSTLPQELRDMVYAHLLNNLWLDRIHPENYIKVDFCHCCVPGRVLCSNNESLPHFLKPDYAPQHVRKEIITEARRIL